MKNIKLILVILFITINLVGCDHKQNLKYTNTNFIPTEKITVLNQLSTSQQEELISIFNKNKLSNIDTFFQWYNNYNILNSTNTIRFDYNSKMLSLLLMENQISVNSKSEYGVYLKPEIEKIETNSAYKLIDTYKDQYIALFNEVAIKNDFSESDYLKAYTKAYKDRQIKFINKKVALINIVINDNSKDLSYIGHSGIMIDLQPGYLFIEKLGPFSPYQFSICLNKEKIYDMLLRREEYQKDNVKFNTYLLENDIPYCVK